MTIMIALFTGVPKELCSNGESGEPELFNEREAISLLASGFERDQSVSESDDSARILSTPQMVNSRSSSIPRIALQNYNRFELFVGQI